MAEIVASTRQTHFHYTLLTEAHTLPYINNKLITYRITATLDSISIDGDSYTIPMTFFSVLVSDFAFGALSSVL